MSYLLQEYIKINKFTIDIILLPNMNFAINIVRLCDHRILVN